MRDVLVNAWREIKRRRRRSIWAGFGYMVAVCFLVIAVSLLLSAGEKSRQTLWKTGAQFVAFIVDRDAASARWREIEGEGFYAHNNPTALFSTAKIDEVRKSPHVRHAAPILSFRLRADHARTLTVAGFDANDMEAVQSVSCSASDIVDGELLVPGDQDVVLLEQTFAAADNLRVGDSVKLGDRILRVKGIIGPGTRPVKADIYLPLEAAIAVVNSRLSRPLDDEVNMVLVDGVNSLTHGQAISEVERILGPGSATVGYGCWKPAGRAVNIGLKGMGRVALLVSVFIGVWIVLSQAAAVNERRRDIGVLKAIGWSNRHVATQIVAEAMILAFIGGVVGTLAAALILNLPPAVRGLAATESVLLPFPVWITLAGLCMTVALGVISALLPARLAAGVRPADMLRRV